MTNVESSPTQLAAVAVVVCFVTSHQRIALITVQYLLLRLSLIL